MATAAPLSSCSPRRMLTRVRSEDSDGDGNQGSGEDTKGQPNKHDEDGGMTHVPMVNVNDGTGGKPLDFALGLSPLSHSFRSRPPQPSVVPLSQSSGTWLQGGSPGGAIDVGTAAS